LIEEWSTRPLYSNTFSPYHFFIFAYENASLPDPINETEELSAEDQAAWSALQAHFATIEQEVIVTSFWLWPSSKG